jgi:hypothetical protein
MERMTPAVRDALITAIALREGTATELAERFKRSVESLKRFARENHQAIALAAERGSQRATEGTEPTPTELDELWITNKFERLKRLQDLAELQFQDAAHGDLVGADLSTALREFRSYLALAANELGQLLHRGSGESGTHEMLNVNIEGIDMEQLR